MLMDSLRHFVEAEKKLWLFTREEELREKCNSQNLSDETISMLEWLIKKKIYALIAFDILLRAAPERALTILRKDYLYQDLTCHSGDHVEDMPRMLYSIKKILGEDKLKEVLNSREFSPKNKNNKRVKAAIKFAMEKD